MNDVLPKPFTKEGMLRALEKHLPQFKKSAQFANSAPMPHPGGFVAQNQGHAPLGLNMGQLSAPQSLKDEPSPGKSPGTATSWHSPGQMPSQSPLGNGPGNYLQQPMRDNNQYSMTPTHPQGGYQAQNPAMGGQRGQTHRRVMSDMSGTPQPDEHPEKRQRTAMYPPAPGSFV